MCANKGVTTPSPSASMLVERLVPGDYNMGFFATSYVLDILYFNAFKDVGNWN